MGWKDLKMSVRIITGKPCYRCGNRERYSKNRCCVFCHRRNSQERYYTKLRNATRIADSKAVMDLKVKKAHDLRQSGYTLREIAGLLGLSHQGVSYLLKRKEGE